MFGRLFVVQRVPVRVLLFLRFDRSAAGSVVFALGDTVLLQMRFSGAFVFWKQGVASFGFAIWGLCWYFFTETDD